MKTIQDMIADLTGVTVEQEDIYLYLENEKLNLYDANLPFSNLGHADLTNACLEGAKITKKQLDQLIIEEDE
ncbi:pentapeptide repeat-containing protein [Spiroplasma citri]|uniref:pentapeptide repeat-containing protein n=1 Tax=Spiroplasma citri TaxID=2133 RepID=UPI0013A08A15|nr:pentapeptide repeat-containing protein [Spiroplasma citri]QIA67751.1 hypothetical protein GMI18_09210 [Spiroplasma citri]QIA73326.1 hypothetical protein GL982_06750 [Spiroplasma citri]